MPHSSLSPLSVVRYSKDYIFEFVRYITGWGERSEVASKTQLHYLCQYLEVDHVDCKTIVVESDYIDRHYLEDYAEYYARCFPAHPRKCSRLHFFADDFSETECIDFLEGRREDLGKRLDDSYIGFAVIRPIPRTIFARICLRPYKALRENSNCKILTRDVDVSLFGKKLTVKTIPFIEQDKVVSACATSALWVALSAHKDVALSNLPSPSAITKAATSGSADAARVFPTKGLNPPQILMGLRSFGLEPSIVWNDRRPIDELKAHVYSYLSNETTVILGGDIYAKNGSDTYRRLGSHLVCVTGYAMDFSDSRENRGHRLHSRFLSKLYVHDDRCGPFLKINTEIKRFPIEPGSEELSHLNVDGERAVKVDGQSIQGLGMEMVVRHHSANYFVPSVAIVGLYHKIRIPYTHIDQTCSALYKYLDATLDDLKRLDGEIQDRDAIDFYQSMATALEQLLNGCWEITLITSSRLKEEISTSPDFYSFNGLEGKSSFLMQNMPRFIWRCRIHESFGSGEVSDILFDATEVPQGNIVVGYIARTLAAQEAWTYVDDCISKRVWQRYKTDDDESREYIGAFVKFFDKTANASSLNAYYGPLGLPRRPLKIGETDDINAIAKRVDTFTVRLGDANPNWGFLDKSKAYIWVINDVGDIVIGEDVALNGEFKGHPTLIDGRPGRIAGELHFDVNIGSWVLNLKSGAYSGHVAVSDRRRYLDEVIRLNLRGLNVVPEPSKEVA